MREIKFRAWDKKKQRMWYGIEGFYDGLGYEVYPTGCESHFADFLESDQQIVMQFTNLHDKNGVEIYEGDIVRTTVAHSLPNGKLDLNAPSDIKVFAVEWREFSVGFNLIKTTISTNEVIGNVYENKDLLEGKS